MTRPYQMASHPQSAASSVSEHPTHPSLIDPELFSSLRIIWGRHADPNGESIKRDLCTPAGRGVHAKAFYFFLGRYREDSLRARDGGSLPTSALDGIKSMRFDLGWELDLNGNTAAKQYDVSSQRSSTTAHSRAGAAPSDEDLGMGMAERDVGADAEDEHEELPLLTAPRTANVELQKTMDAVAERLNGLVKAQAVPSPVLPPSPLGHPRVTNRAVSRPTREDKENQTTVKPITKRSSM